MKRSLWFLLSLILGSFFAFAQTAPTANSVSVHEAENFISSASNRAAVHEFISDVLQSKRADLIALCFENPNTCLQVVTAAKKLPDSIDRDRLVLFMLKTPSPYWPREPHLVGSAAVAGLDQPFIDVLRKYLPDLKLHARLLSTSVERNEIASALEQAIASHNESLTASRSISSPASTPQSIAKKSPYGGAASATTDIHSQRLGAETKSKKGWWYIIFVPLALIIITFFVTRTRNRKFGR